MITFAAMLLVLQSAGTAAPQTRVACSAAEERALEVAERHLSSGDLAAARRRLESSAARPDACPAATLARVALAAWQAARDVAPQGGAPALLRPVHEGLARLDELRAVLLALREGAETAGQDDERQAIAIAIEYAQIAVRAAVAAAQDERPELELLLTHARDLVERLAARGRRAVWPRSYNLLAGELWFEVDRYEEARAAYERAVRSGASAAALVGLARAEARLGARESACATFRRATDAAPVLRAAAAADLETCR